MNYFKEEDRALNQYLKEIAKFPLLSREEEIILARRAQKGDLKAKDELTKSNLLFVVKVANESRYQNRGLSLSELISEGYYGLLKAVEHFDSSRRLKFISYAVWWIRQSIQEALSQRSSSIRLPSNQVEKLFQYNRAVQRASQASQTGDPDLETIAKELNIDPYILTGISKKLLSLDQPFNENDERTPLDVLANEEPPPEKQIDYTSLQEKIREVLSTLNEREAKIIKLYFGLNGGPELTLEQIGNRLGVTRERIRQIKEKALRRLRHPSRKKRLEPYNESTE